MSDFVSCPNCDRTQMWCIDCVSREVLRCSRVAAAQERVKLISAIRGRAAEYKRIWRQTCEYLALNALADWLEKR